MKPIRVLIVDDSALMRQMLTSIIESAKDMQVIAAAPDPIIARRMIRELDPDVVTLDVEMPRMDGLSFLEKIMALRPTPVVMVSSLTQKGAQATVSALEIGAVDFVAKPASGNLDELLEKGDELLEKIRVASRARLTSYTPRGTNAQKPRPRIGATEVLIAIGASTGGVDAVKSVLSEMPADAPGTLIVQHMPAGFTSSFAARLDASSAMKVCEALDGQRILPGHAYLAPGSHHLELAKRGADFVCKLNDGPLVSGHRPSADTLFNSFAALAQERAIGVILTGMGKDGAAGLKAMRDAGAPTLGQDEASCVVYGMPRAAQEAGAVVEEFPLNKIASRLCNLSAKFGADTIRI